ncbi:hypothetical protein [Cryobacterium tepidiphilum]|uniref:AbiEi antitoxin C-terminal domain-containing protein n=1 Tax=Cryobacterium tepidiphilum TaxID=2486026 RepID=A0A3M8L2S7_9MICO|nr:hypothetical protein [Cryobacterium tepidiphilum]RNE59199.1 hypothetical protein EEJ31_10540 [Cryobacterium tepidiphilum]
MSDASEVLVAHGGIAHLSTLRSHGVRPEHLRKLLDARLLVRPRQGWYALPSTAPELLQAVTVGGQVSCVSALRLWEVWCIDDHRTHVRVPSNAARLSKPRTVVAHCAAHPGVDRSSAIVGIVEALAQAFTCLSRENIIVALDSALNKGLISPHQLTEIRGLVARRYHPYFRPVDGERESGLETKCVLRLHRLNIRCRVQVRIPGVWPG